MFAKEDREFLKKSEYSMALEKFFSKELEITYYSQQNDINRREKNVGMNLAIETVYPFTNENLFELFKGLNIKGKSVATAGSSGDQMLAALLFGAKKVTLIDGNLYSKHFIDFKFAAIKNLPYEEFKTHFIDSNNYFDFEIFQKISHDLDPDSMAFWGTIYSHTTDAREIKNRIANFNNQRPKTDFLYSEEVYKKLQEILTNGDFELDFEIAEFNDFPEVLTETYDAILLSNIFQYVNPDDYVRVVFALQEKLNPEGTIQLNYDFPGPLGHLRADKTESFKKVFQSDSADVYSVQFEADRLYMLKKPDEKEKGKEKLD